MVSPKVIQTSRYHQISMGKKWWVIFSKLATFILPSYSWSCCLGIPWSQLKRLRLRSLTSRRHQFPGAEDAKFSVVSLRNWEGTVRSATKEVRKWTWTFFFVMRQIQTSWIVCFLLGTVAIFWTQATSLMLMHIADIAGAWFRTGRQRQESIRTFPVASSSALLHGRWSLRPRWRGGAWIAWRTARCQDVDLVLNMVKAFWLNIS